MLAGLGLFHNVAAAQEKEFKSNRLFLGLGWALVRFDSNAKFTDKESGRRIFVDLEGTLNLPERDSVPTLYGYYRFAKKHGIGFQYFRINELRPFWPTGYEPGGREFESLRARQKSEVHRAWTSLFRTGDSNSRRNSYDDSTNSTGSNLNAAKRRPVG